MSSIIQIRRDTAANWTSANPTLAQGEMGFETDTNKIKIGDGSTTWNSLEYCNASITYNNISVVTIEGKSWSTVNLGVTAWTCDFDVRQQRNFTDHPISGTLDGTTSTTQMEDTSKDFRYLGSIQGTGTSRANTAANRIQFISDVQLQIQANDYIHNLTTDEWGYLQTFNTNSDINVVGFSSGHIAGDDYEFHSGPNNWVVRNITLGIIRPVSGFNPANPSILPHSTVAGQTSGNSYAAYSATSLWQWDKENFSVLMTFPNSEHSDPPTSSLINIYNNSTHRMNFVVRWRV